MARRLGWTEDQINNLHHFESRPDFTDREKAGLRLAERMAADAHSIDDLLWAELRRHFDEGELIELLAAFPDDGPSKSLLKRVQDYRASPPPADWDGVYVAKDK